MFIPIKRYKSTNTVVIFLLFFTLLLCSACFDETNLRYKQSIKSIQTQQAILQGDYQLIDSEEVKGAYLILAHSCILKAITHELFEPWYGTTWAMNGTSQTPQKGAIACGYFVSTILRDAGFRVNRRELAQQASEKIVKTLAQEKHIKRFKKTPLQKFIKSVREMGEGLYVVGLDTHVGFLEVTAKETYFIHAAQSTGRKVVKEKAITSKVLRKSKYRIAGNILANDQLLEKWLKNERVVTVK